jgi:hypothetical protein
VLPGLVAKLIGLPDSDVPRLVEWGYGSTELLGGVLEGRLPVAVDAAIQLAGYLHGAFEAARSDPDDDLLGDLAAAVNAGDVEPHVAVLMLVQLVGAGCESTAGLIGNAARLLATNPETQDAVRTDPKMIPALLEETLRLESPFRGHHRHVVADTVLARTCPLARTCCCSGDRPTATKPRSPSRTGFDSTGHRHGVIWPSARDCTSASGRRWPARRPGSRLTRCSRTPLDSAWPMRSGCQASWFAATDGCS